MRSTGFSFYLFLCFGCCRHDATHDESSWSVSRHAVPALSWNGASPIHATAAAAAHARTTTTSAAAASGHVDHTFCDYQWSELAGSRLGRFHTAAARRRRRCIRDFVAGSTGTTTTASSTSATTASSAAFAAATTNAHVRVLSQRCCWSSRRHGHAPRWTTPSAAIYVSCAHGSGHAAATPNVSHAATAAATTGWWWHATRQCHDARAQRNALLSSRAEHAVPAVRWRRRWTLRRATAAAPSTAASSVSAR